MLLIGLIVGLLPASSLALAAQDGTPMAEPVTAVQVVISTKDESVIEDAEAILVRMEHGLSMTLDTTGLVPGEAYTVWWVIFNLPENCSDDLCGPDDVFLVDDLGQFILDENGQWQPNFPGREAAQVSSLRADGRIAYEDGSALFKGHLPIGDTTDDVVFGPGLIYPMSAEVHLIVRTHGPAIPGLTNEQLFTAWGGCPDPTDRSPCDDVQTAVFMPPNR
jgi:hypothetical protein